MIDDVLKVLMIEDSPEDALLIKEMLRDCRQVRLEEETARSLTRGREMLITGNFDALLLDLNLPDSSGIKTAESITTDFPSLPVVVMTVPGDESTGYAAVRRGCQDYIIKGKQEATAMCSSIAFAVQHKQTLSSLQQALKHQRHIVKGALAALVGLTALRDPLTATHQRRVSHLAGLMAHELGWTEDDVEFIRTAGILHDIGKVAVPVEILYKPEPLSLTERSLEQAHVQATYDVIKDIEFPWPVAKAILQHHERLDGSGYPGGLSGSQIIPEAHILIVADVMDGMCTPRPWRSETPGYEKAVKEMENGRGRLYDEEAADACLKLFREQGFRFED